jgi:hypothetical protein
MTICTNADYSCHQTMEEHFGMSTEKVYADLKLAVILLKDNNFFATDDFYTIDTDDICE